MPTGESKTCSKCGAVKPLEEFYKQKGCRLGVRPDCKECMRARIAVYRAENAAQHVQRSLDWAVRNPEKVRAYKRKWDAAHPEAVRDKTRRHRALRKAAFVADVRFDDILQRDLGVCGICERQITQDAIDLDHVIPIVAGGTHEPNNVQLAHPTCNKRKHAKVGFTLAA
jgi:5-methylcytosine-specific restriction endonuclease McrA